MPDNYTKKSKNPYSSLAKIASLWVILSTKRKKQLFILLSLMVCAGVSEMISIGALIPFLGVLLSPDDVLNNQITLYITSIKPVSNENELRLLLTFFFCAAALIAALFRVILYWLNTYLSQMVGFDLEQYVFRESVLKPYHMQLGKHSSEIITGVDKAKTCAGIFLSILNITTSIIIGTFIVISLYIIQPKISVVAFLSLAAIYIVISYFTRKRLVANGEIIASKRTQRLKTMQETLGGIRDIILDKTHEYYLKIFFKINYKLSKASANNLFTQQYPRVLIELIIILAVSSSAYYYSAANNIDMSLILPILAAFALGVQRLLPLLQQIFKGWAVIKSSQASLTDVVKLVEDKNKDFINKASEKVVITFNKKIDMHNVCFRYDNKNDDTLHNVNITIHKNDKIGVIGKTGVGKSTLLDIFMGLLFPTDGDIYIDNKQLKRTDYYNWQKYIAHVPQSIFLADLTIAENIAISDLGNKIDENRLISSAKLARVNEFVNIENGGLFAKTGERGTKLSGGQRQRIGIARALYKNCPVLVLDEATNALDHVTEKQIIDAICAVKDLTVLIVSHRHSILAACDNIYVMHSHGRLTKQTLQELAVDKI